MLRDVAVFHDLLPHSQLLGDAIPHLLRRAALNLVALLLKALPDLRRSEALDGWEGRRTQTLRHVLDAPEAVGARLAITRTTTSA